MTLTLQSLLVTRSTKPFGVWLEYKSQTCSHQLWLFQGSFVIGWKAPVPTPSSLHIASCRQDFRSVWWGEDENGKKQQAERPPGPRT